MGDRANIVILDDFGSGGEVWLYGHWSGERYEDDLRRALAKRWRWGDPSYLARIVFEEMIKGNEGTENSFGISTSMGDNEHLILTVDCDKKEVRWDYEPKDGQKRETKKRQSFEEFVATTVLEGGTA
ncbi:MAG: hypothetical protein V3R16_09600 [Nitrospirales bacterium]